MHSMRGLAASYGDVPTLSVNIACFCVAALRTLARVCFADFNAQGKMGDTKEGKCEYAYWGPFDQALGQLCRASLTDLITGAVDYGVDKLCQHVNYFPEDNRWACHGCNKCSYCGSKWCMEHLCCSGTCLHRHLGMLRSV